MLTLSIDLAQNYHVATLGVREGEWLVGHGSVLGMIGLQYTYSPFQHTFLTTEAGRLKMTIFSKWP